MPEVSFQIVTRSARRRALAISEQTQAGVANASAQTTTQRRQTRSAAREQHGNSHTSAHGHFRLATAPRARRRRPAPYARRARCPPITPRAADGREDANTRVVETPESIERDVVEDHNQVEQGPLILNDAFSAQIGEANDSQDEDQPMQVQSERDQPEQDQGQQDQQIDGRNPNEDLGAVSEPDLTGHEEDSQTPADEGLLVQGNDAGDMIGWMAARPSGSIFAAPAPRERIILDRCTSPTCPIVKTELHERGLYLFAGELNQSVVRLPWGLSNPPPAIWEMARRVYGGGAEQPGDRVAIEGFVRNHAWLAEGPPYGVADDEMVTVT